MPPPTLCCLQTAMECMEADDDMSALRLCSECYAPLTIARQRGRCQPQLMEECEELERSVLRQSCIAATARVHPRLSHPLVSAAQQVKLQLPPGHCVSGRYL